MTERLVEIECESGRVGVYLYGRQFSPLRPKERIWGVALSELVMGQCSEMSYGKATMYTNRFLHRDAGDSLCVKTVGDFVGRKGLELDAIYTEVSEGILSEHHIDKVTGVPDPDLELPQNMREPPKHTVADKERVARVAALYNDKHDGLQRIPESKLSALPEGSVNDCVYVFVDDVLVKHQKDHRSPDSKRDTKFVSNTVIRIEHDGKGYDIVAANIQEAFKRLMAFLLWNHLMEDKRLIFITDGATEIKEYVQAYFGFRQYSLYLDWFHLQKKCYQMLSYGLKCGKAMKEDKERIEEELYGILWTGNASGAIDYINSIDAKHIKLQSAIDSLVGYINRKKEHIPCYAIRKGLGLRNSSNPVEKANDVIVAHRQKGKGMAWSADGSVALATITMAERNNELKDVLMGGMPKFKLVA